MPVQVTGDRTDVTDIRRLDVVEEGQGDLTTMHHGTFSEGAGLEVKLSLAKNLGADLIDKAGQALEQG